MASMEVGFGSELWLSVLGSVKITPCAARTLLTELTVPACAFVVGSRGHRTP